MRRAELLPVGESPEDQSENKGRSHGAACEVGNPRGLVFNPVRTEIPGGGLGAQFAGGRDFFLPRMGVSFDLVSSEFSESIHSIAKVGDGIPLLLSGFGRGLGVALICRESTPPAQRIRLPPDRGIGCDTKNPPAPFQRFFRYAG